MNAFATVQPSLGGAFSSREEGLYEIVNGQKVELLPMSIYANRIAGSLFFQLYRHADASRLGTAVIEALFVLDPVKNIRRRPDVAFVSAEQWPLDRLLPETGDWQLVPDLAIEVVSPNDIFRDVIGKMHEYFHFGARQVWIVIPEDREVYVYESPSQVRVFTASDEIDGGSILPGWRMAVKAMFQGHQTATDTHA